MTITELQAVLDHHGVKIDGYRGGAGKFRDLEIGVGQPRDKLAAVKADLKAKADWLEARITHVTNTDHADYGKPYVEVKSYWWE